MNWIARVRAATDNDGGILVNAVALIALIGYASKLDEDDINGLLDDLIGQEPS